MMVKSIRQAKKIAGKTVLLRADLNVHIKDGLVKDDYKIITSLPTIRFLLRHNCRIIVATHLSKKLKNKTSSSIKPIAKRLAELLGRKVLFIDACSGPKVVEAMMGVGEREIVMLENLRSDSREEKNNKRFAKELANLADIYINEAFAVSHRRHASVDAIKKYLPSYGGLLLEREVENLLKILKPKQPLVSIIGGSKIQTKTALIKNLAKHSYKILIGGALANNFIAAHGFKIGKSVADKSSIKLAAALIRKFDNIILPVDVLVAKKINSDNFKVKPVNQVKSDEFIFDIGPKTVKLFTGFIKKANTIVWNGPMGYFENEHFKHGTLAVARIVATRSTGRAFGVAGGGATIEALNITKMENYLDWISTGGGAMLAFLGGEPMPGLKGIVKY